MSDSECVNVIVLVKDAPLRSDAVNELDSVNMLESENVFDTVNVFDFVKVSENVFDFVYVFDSANVSENVFDTVNVFDCVNVCVGGRHSSSVVSLETSKLPNVVPSYASDVITDATRTPEKALALIVGCDSP